MTVRFVGPPDDAALPRVDGKLLRERARGALAALGHSRSELSLTLTDDAGIAELNQTWRGKPGPTDVLSFSLFEGDHTEHRGALLGDVVIGLAQAARQARAGHRGLDRELAHLAIHGILHLLGHDHEKPDEARLMRAEERRLRRAVGIARTGVGR
ncbi:MAG: rRNA maturation RNase YbeY [Deltaproteobacteria bacterium]|nr:rRNA maturation RNase YbeY [Deltaproteobacteria bacterium]MBW2446946.1 rRNA maturation RNase YbeY [Deltaproteobacteria bacterium]